MHGYACFLDYLPLTPSNISSAFTNRYAKYTPMEKIHARMTIAEVKLARIINSLKQH